MGRVYGPGIKAYVLNLLIVQMISLKRAQQSIKTLIGQAIDEATILKYVMLSWSTDSLGPSF